MKETYDYYPFGLQMPGRIFIDGGAQTKNLFTGKERDSETNWDYFGARYYGAGIGRWLVVDPLASKYPGWSPYNYSLNDPTNKYDPDGRFVGTLIGTVVGAATGAINAAVNNESILAGAVEGGTAGAIAGLIVDVTVASGGTALAIVGAGIAGGGAGGAIGDVLGQVTGQVAGGETLSNAIGNVDLGQTGKKAAIGAATGLLGGAVGAGMKVLGNSVAKSVGQLQGVMSETVEAVAQTTGSFGSQGTQQIVNSMGEIGDNAVNLMLKVEAGSAAVTETALNATGQAIDSQINKKEDEKKNQ